MTMKMRIMVNVTIMTKLGGEGMKSKYGILGKFDCHDRDCAMVDVMRMLIMIMYMMNRL